MGNAPLDSIAGGFCELFRQQMEAVVGRKFKDFAKDELEDYQSRARQIRGLRSELEKLVRSTQATVR